MKTDKSRTIIYDNTCPMCSWYTKGFVNAGVLKEKERVSFQELDTAKFTHLDLQRARHEIPLVDTTSGEVLYGLDGLTVLISDIFPSLRPVVTRPFFRKLLRPLYAFISYNRRVIAGSFNGGVGFNCAPDFHLGWRLALIAFGIGYTAFGIYLFSLIAGVGNVAQMFAVVFLYFLSLLISNIIFNKTFEEKVDYIGHLATLGFIESTFFVATALLAKFTGLPELLFAGQGAGRVIAFWLHAKRVENNHYSTHLNYTFAAGAIGLVVYLAYILN